MYTYNMIMTTINYRTILYKKTINRRWKEIKDSVPNIHTARISNIYVNTG